MKHPFKGPSAPPPDEGPGNGLRAPGDCSEEEYNELRGKVVLWCRKYDGAKKLERCTEITRIKLIFYSCEWLEEAAKRWQWCGEARKELDDRCFRGGDREHRHERDKAFHHAAVCWYWYNIRGCGREWDDLFEGIGKGEIA